MYKINAPITVKIMFHGSVGDIRIITREITRDDIMVLVMNPK